MKYASTGTITSGPEVTDVSPFGLWLLYRGKEYFLAYESFPWFLHAPLQKVFAVIEEGVDHLRWPALDIDLSMDAIKDPGAYPLVYEPAANYGQEDRDDKPSGLSAGH